MWFSLVNVPTLMKTSIQNLQLAEYFKAIPINYETQLLTVHLLRIKDLGCNETKVLKPSDTDKIQLCKRILEHSTYYCCICSV